MWREDFAYANGPLDLEGGWITSAIFGQALDVVSNTATDASASAQGSSNSTVLATADLAAPYNLSITFDYVYSPTNRSAIQIIIGDIAGRFLVMTFSDGTGQGLSNQCDFTYLDPDGNSHDMTAGQYDGTSSNFLIAGVNVLQIVFDGTTVSVSVNGIGFFSFVPSGWGTVTTNDLDFGLYSDGFPVAGGIAVTEILFNGTQLP